MRGFRLVEIGALAVLLALALAVYLVKARAGRETGDIATVESQIADEQRSLRLLQAEVAHLEQPERLLRLAQAIGLGPTSDKRETGAGPTCPTSPASPPALAADRAAAATPTASAQTGALR